MDAQMLRDFAAALPAPDATRWEAVLAERLEAAATAWPALPRPAADFAAHLARLLPPALPVSEGLAALRVEDLYLAWACSRGLPEAWAAFERSYFGEVNHAVTRLRAGSSVDPDDVKQHLREKLFMHKGEAQPVLAKYSGKGELRTWLRVLAVRACLDQLRARTPSPALPIELPPVLDPELAHIQRQYQEQFRQALSGAVADLDPRERAVLRCAHVEGLTLEQIASVFGAHRATVARWLASGRSNLRLFALERLRRELRLTQSELQSAVRLLQSQVDFSLRSLFSSTSAESVRAVPG